MSEEADRMLSHIGLRVLKRRQELGLTQQQLAEAVGMNQSYVAKIEQGKQNITIRTLVKLADALGVKALADLVEPQ